MSSDKKRLPGWVVFLAWLVMACVFLVMGWVIAFLPFGFQSKPTETKERICPVAGPCIDIPIESP